MNSITRALITALASTVFALLLSTACRPTVKHCRYIVHKHKQRILRKFNDSRSRRGKICALPLLHLYSRYSVYNRAFVIVKVKQKHGSQRNWSYKI